jgi:hypothetical protein
MSFFSKFFIILLLTVSFSQVALAQKFEVLSSNTLKYPSGFMLTEKHKVRLGVGQKLVLKVPNRAKKIYINGPYVHSPYAVTSNAGKNCKKDSLIGVLTCLLTTGQGCDKCKPNDFTCTIRCRKPFLPHDDSESSQDSFIRDWWNSIKPRLFKEILPPSSNSQKTNEAEKITLPDDPWVLVAPSDENFCYRPDKPLTIWRPELLTGQLIYLTNPSDKQDSRPSTTGMNDLLVIRLHTMPDDKTLPSNTYKAVWMAEQGCYRQAQLLLSSSSQ